MSLHDQIVKTVAASPDMFSVAISLQDLIVGAAMASPEFTTVTIYHFVDRDEYDVETTTVIKAANTSTHIERRVTNDLFSSKEILNVQILRLATQELCEKTGRKLRFKFDKKGGSPRMSEIYVVE